MDFFNISRTDFVLNEEKYVNLLHQNDIYTKIPSLNLNLVENFAQGTLVKFRGMIQDMHGPEYFLQSYKLIDNVTKEETRYSGKYCDNFPIPDGKTLVENFDFQHESSERHNFVAISVPGLNSWVLAEEKLKYSIPESAEMIQNLSGGQKKRFIEDLEVEENSNKKLLQANSIKTPAAKEHLFINNNHPLNEKDTQTCLVKIYNNMDKIKLNEVYEFVGFLSLTVMENEFEDYFGNELEKHAHNPPSSLIPRLHVIYTKNLQHINPLVLLDNNFSSSVNVIIVKNELLKIFTQLLFGDSLTAEYLIYNLISEIYSRNDDCMMALGKFTLNISNIPNKLNDDLDYVKECSKIIELFVTKSHYLSLTLDNLNSLKFIPTKDYESNRLLTGILQLSKNTHLILDETKLNNGTLNSSGIKTIQVIQSAIKTQKISYDFNYFPMEYDCDIPFLIFSEGKSLLLSDILVKLKPEDESSFRIFKEILEALKHYLLNRNLLCEIRKYLTEVKFIDYKIEDKLQEYIQEDFVKMRQEKKNNCTSDDFHKLLVLSRLISISEGKSSLDENTWNRAKLMENERKNR